MEVTSKVSVSQCMSWKKVYHKYKRLRPDSPTIFDRLGYSAEEMLFENYPLSIELRNYVGSCF